MTARRAIGLVVTAALAIMLIAALSGDDRRIVRAEFTNARGLLQGNEVRVQGAPAGSVEQIELTQRNTAIVTVRVRDDIAAPRSDASAAIRPVDLLGDVYLALDLGVATGPLEEPIPPGRTSNAPRLDDLLRAFAPQARDGLRALIVSLGQGLEGRGEDVNDAVLRLRPALREVDALMGRLNDQRTSLRELVRDAQRTTRQLAARRGDLGTTIDAFATTAQAVAERADPLDAGLRQAPGLLRRLTATSRRLERTATAAIPLARTIGEVSPDLAVTTADLPPFADAARRALNDTRPLIRDLGATLEAARPGASRLAEGLGALTTAAPSIDALSRALVPAAKPISEGFFVNFADQAAEPGNQPFDPFGDPARRYWRGAAVFSCESFGLVVARGCLSRYLRDAPGKTARPSPAARPSRPAGPEPSGPRPAGPAPARPTVPVLPLGLDDAVDDILDAVADGLGETPVGKGADDLLEYLLTP